MKQFEIIASNIFCWVICCMMILIVCQSRAAAHKMFGNMTYVSDDPYTRGKITLTDGQYEWEHVTNDGFFLYYCLRYLNHYVYGDFNRDGLQDAAVILTEGEGGSGDFRKLAFLINDGHQLVHRASCGLGDSIIINAVKEREDKVVIDMYTHREDDCRAGPTKRVKNVYGYLQLSEWCSGW